MKRPPTSPAGNDVQALRLIALGRVARCSRCPRYAALVEARAGRPRRPLPEAPAGCLHRICAPLVRRQSFDGRTVARVVGL